MQIKSLNNTSLEDIVFTILMAFDRYFVTMPSDTDYWKKRFACARVDWEYSYGMFDEQGILIGFIINGIDQVNHKWVAFNTGTGVVPKYRGQKIVDQLYNHAFPHLKAKGIDCCVLEVIQENHRAIRVYERIGFSIQKEYECFKGTIAPSSYRVHLKEISMEELKEKPQDFYAWDNSYAALIRAEEGQYQVYEVCKEEEAVGFFVINPQVGYLPQFEIYQPQQSKHWLWLFEGIAQINSTVKINNINSKRTELIQQLQVLNLEQTISQYEMELSL